MPGNEGAPCTFPFCPSTKQAIGWREKERHHAGILEKVPMDSKFVEDDGTFNVPASHTFIRTNITGMANPLAGGPDRNLGITKSGDSLFSILPISPIERDGSFLTFKYPGSTFQPKVRQRLPKRLLLSSIIGQATTNGAGSPWIHPLAFCSTGHSPYIGYYTFWDSYQRGFQRKDAD